MVKLASNLNTFIRNARHNVKECILDPSMVAGTWSKVRYDVSYIIPKVSRKFDLTFEEFKTALGVMIEVVKNTPYPTTSTLKTMVTWRMYWDAWVLSHLHPSYSTQERALEYPNVHISSEEYVGAFGAGLQVLQTTAACEAYTISGYNLYHERNIRVEKVKFCPIPSGSLTCKVLSLNDPYGSEARSVSGTMLNDVDIEHQFTVDDFVDGWTYREAEAYYTDLDDLSGDPPMSNIMIPDAVAGSSKKENAFFTCSKVGAPSVCQFP